MNCSSVDPSYEMFPSTNVTASENTGMMCALTFSLLFGLPTQSYVIWLIITGSRNRVASEFFILNISVSEIIFFLFALIYLQRVTNLSFQGSGQLTALMFLTGNIIITRPLFQCLNCVESYLAVVHPVTFLKYKPLRYRVICCTVVWITGLGSCLLCMFVVGSINIQWGKNVFSQPPTVQVLPLKKMRERPVIFIIGIPQL